MCEGDHVVVDDPVGPVTVGMGRFVVLIGTEPPQMLAHYMARAAVVDEFTTADDRSSVGYCFIGVGDGGGGGWPQLLVTQRFSPAGYGFSPGVLLVAETGGLFIGAGTRLLGYLLDSAGIWQRTSVVKCRLPSANGQADEALFDRWSASGMGAGSAGRLAAGPAVGLVRRRRPR